MSGHRRHRVARRGSPIGALLALTMAVHASAAERRMAFDRLSLEDGLSQSIVEDIAQDRRGFMWFVTEDGLNRYDGSRFVVFRNRPGVPHSLSHNELKVVYEDTDGILWLGAFSGGLNRFDPHTEQVTRFEHDPADPTSLGGETVRAIVQDRAGDLWIGTQGGGLDRFDRSTGMFEQQRADPEGSSALDADDVRALVVGRDGALWVGTNGGGLVRRDPHDGVTTRLRHRTGDRVSLADDRVTALLEDRSGRLWVGTASGLDHLDPASGRFTHILLPRIEDASAGIFLVRDLLEDHQGTLWIAFDGAGLGRLVPRTGRVELIRHDPLDPTSLSTDRVWSLAEDMGRVLWVGTYGGGLNRFDLARERFRHERHDPEDPTSLGDAIVWSFWQDADGTLWVGTDSGGLNRRDPRTGRWRHLRHDPDDPQSLADTTVRALHRDREGRLWVATNGGGLDRYDPETGGFVHHRHDPEDPTSLAHDDLRSVMQDSTGQLWVSTFGGGLDRLDPATGRWQHLRHDPDDPTSLPSDFVRLVAEDRRGRLWVGTQGGGLARLDPDTGRCVRYYHDPDDPESLSNDHVFGIIEDRSGRLWLATFGGGLNRLDPETGLVTRFTVEDGLPSSSLYAVLEDDGGRLWISSTRGLSRFDPSTGAVRSFDVRDGLQSNEFNGGAAYRSPAGELYFGGINGFNAFFPEEIVANPVVPPVVITELLLFNQPIRPGVEQDGRVVLQRPITDTRELTLSWRDAVVTFEFAALHYSAPEKNRYAYRLDGFTDDWIPVAPGRRDATFTGLAPGDYVFHVRGSNCDGVWNEEGTSLGIRVTPPFWGTWWFRALLAVGVAGVALVGMRARVRGVRMRAELDAAHNAQMAIMPQRPPTVPGFDIFALCRPASQVGGDFYDHFWAEDGARRFCMVVGDAAGKAMRAAMTAVMADGMVTSHAPGLGDAPRMMAALNRSLHAKLGPRAFVALCLLLLDPERRELEIADAGLCEPLLCSRGSTRYLSPPGARFPLGAFAAVDYRTCRVTLDEGDVVVVFTDGVPEARGAAGEPYGYEAPLRLLAGLDTAALSAQELAEVLLADVRRFTRGAAATDDVSVLVLKVDAVAGGGSPA